MVQKKIDYNKIKYIFFDFDGVIVDTEKIHIDSFNEVLNKYNISITKKEYFDKYLSYDDKRCFQEVFLVKLNKKLSGSEIKLLINKKTKILMKKIKHKLIVYPDTLKFINFIKENFPKIKFCIVSGALREEIVYILNKLKIKKYFSFIISAEDVKKGKPDPEPFIKARKMAQKNLSKKLNKKEVIVIEDSVNGIKSAKKLGFIVVAVAHSYAINILKKIHNVLVIKKLTELCY
ncbi:MAG: HAD family phosphatase [Endomicrobiia bacterium]